MFFCEPCRVENNWPGIVTRSYGACEVCNKQAPCYDVPSKYLPEPPKTIKMSYSNNDIAHLADVIENLMENYDLKTDTDGHNLAIDFVYSVLNYNDKEIKE